MISDDNLMMLFEAADDNLMVLFDAAQRHANTIINNHTPENRDSDLKIRVKYPDTRLF